MIRTWLFYLVAFPSTLFFSSLGAVCGLVRARPSAFDWIHRNWARSLLWGAGVRLEVQGLEHSVPGRGQIIVANHESMFDIWALMSAVPASLRFVAKEELSKIPVFAAACRAAGHVFIDRRRAAAAGDAMRAAGERMKEEGLTLVLFAEGTRSPDGELRPFRKGAFAIAIETQTFLVPVAIDGTAGILPTGGKRVHPGTVRIRLAEGTSLEGKTSADRDELVRDSQGAVARMLGELRGTGPSGQPTG
ncbi:MAG: 1-acyl-sn-glycerol-3-phosphate acyltransferase [Gemmatimonadota bacterium]|nr:1-acyl-sn-glycerol-3-phosphate acyltransferase [Gemmatimonadota bacterium]